MPTLSPNYKYQNSSNLMKNFLQCVICGDNHFYRNCCLVQITENVPDNEVPSKARRTLPHFLQLQIMIDGTYSVISKDLIKNGTQFGPFLAAKCLTMNPSVVFPLKTSDGSVENEDKLTYFLENTDENECNWLIFVSPAEYIEEQNLICYQGKVYYVVIKDIEKGTTLKVWYSPYYAYKMDKALLSHRPEEDPLKNIERRPVAARILVLFRWFLPRLLRTRREKALTDFFSRDLKIQKLIKLANPKGVIKSENGKVILTLKELDQKIEFQAAVIFCFSFVPSDINTLIKKQQKIVERKVWTCKFCCQMENDIVSFAKHIVNHYHTQLMKTCDVCGTRFSNKKKLRTHMKIVHGSPLQTVEVRNLKKLERSANVYSFGGPLLNDVFSDTSELPQFDVNINNQNLLIDTDNLSVDYLLSENVRDLDHFNFDIDSSNQKQFFCDICLKPFSKLKLLLVHLKCHTGDFMCFKCLKIFCRKESLKAHACNAVYSYRCDQCSKEFSQKKYLSRHIVEVHTKTFRCSKCSRAYLCNKNLSDHNCNQVPLSEKRTFMCSICDKIFYHNKNLKIHMKVHCSSLNGTQDTSNCFTCDICGLSYKSKSAYQLHKKIHTEEKFTCNICLKKFTRLDRLKMHVMCHQNKEVECTVCSKKLKSEKSLKEHVQRHSKLKKIYACNLCNRGFTSLKNLQRHKKTSESKCSKREDNFYTCPVCNKNIKLRSSLLRHVKNCHPSADNIDFGNIKPNRHTAITEDITNYMSINCLDDNNIHMDVVTRKADLLSTVSNKNPENFTQITEIKNEKRIDVSNELEARIKDILRIDNVDNTELSSTAKEVDTLVKELDLDLKITENKGHLRQQTKVCLSIPNLTEADQEITLDKNAYILDNGTIIQPQDDSEHVIIYILDQVFD